MARFEDLGPIYAAPTDLEKILALDLGRSDRHLLLLHHRHEGGHLYIRWGVWLSR